MIPLLRGYDAGAASAAAIDNKAAAARALFRRLKVCRSLDASKRRYGRSIECGAIGPELRSVTWTIPALLQRIPMHDAAEVGAARRMQMQRAVLIAAGGNLF